jgi:transcriptional regulator
MYIPQANKEDRLPILHKFMEENPFASLITLNASGLIGSHIPIVLDAADGSPFGTLRCHLSRANPQWRDPSTSIEALAIFIGPEHYITPNWYPEKAATQKVVPTWNYAVVHAYGHLRIIEDHDWLLTHLERLTNIHEAASPSPWKIQDAPADYIATLAKGIVGVEMVITRLEGKWKASQNRSEADRQGVAHGLAELDTLESLAMKALVERRD